MAIGQYSPGGSKQVELQSIVCTGQGKNRMELPYQLGYLAGGTRRHVWCGAALVWIALGRRRRLEVDACRGPVPDPAVGC